MAAYCRTGRLSVRIISGTLPDMISVFSFVRPSSLCVTMVPLLPADS